MLNVDYLASNCSAVFPRASVVMSEYGGCTACTCVMETSYAYDCALQYTEQPERSTALMTRHYDVQTQEVYTVNMFNMLC